jgi:hypothetical protein
MIVIDVYSPNPETEASNSLGYFPDSAFVKTGMIGVPFVAWKKDREPNSQGIKETIGSIVITRSKVTASGLTINSRLKFGGFMYRLTSMLQSVNQIYTITFVHVQSSDAMVSYVEPIAEGDSL